MTRNESQKGRELRGSYRTGEEHAEVGLRGAQAHARNKSDLEVWDLAGILILVESRHFVERWDFPSKVPARSHTARSDVLRMKAHKNRDTNLPIPIRTTFLESFTMARAGRVPCHFTGNICDYMYQDPGLQAENFVPRFWF